MSGRSLYRFFAYHNAVPVGISLLLLSSTAAFAASPEVREAILDTEVTVVSVDNTYLVSKNLGEFKPSVVIQAVTEDADNYYVSYRLSTIAMVDYVWRDTGRDGTLTVAKALLGGTKDLGVYATEQLGQLVDRELAYLQEVQTIESKQVSQKMVATAYTGLIGKFLDSTTEELPGYVPVVAGTTAQGGTDAPSEAGQTQAAPAAVSGQSSNTSGTGDTTPPTVQLLGNNPARITIGSTYADLGVVVSDNITQNPSVDTYLNGALVTSVTIDTKNVGNWTIRYEARDADGNSAFIERQVEVYDATAPSEPVPPGEPPAEQSSTTPGA